MAEDKFAVSQEFTLENVKITDTFKKCLEWCSKKKASIIEKSEPYYIKLFYQGLSDPTPYFSQLYMYINLSEAKGSVSVLFQIPSTVDTSIDVYWRYCARLVKEFADFIGVDEKQTEVKLTKMLGYQPPKNSIWREMNPITLSLLGGALLLLSVYFGMVGLWDVSIVILVLCFVLFMRYAKLFGKRFEYY
jgi:hypothetical protein